MTSLTKSQLKAIEILTGKWSPKIAMKTPFLNASSLVKLYRLGLVDALTIMDGTRYMGDKWRLTDEGVAFKIAIETRCAKIS